MISWTAWEGQGSVLEDGMGGHSNYDWRGVCLSREKNGKSRRYSVIAPGRKSRDGSPARREEQRGGGF
jgi:hypothetical protein